MKKIILCPNPYRDKGFRGAFAAEKLLKDLGIETKMCLPFDVDKSFELPKKAELHDLSEELPESDMLICFGGDGTILHSSKQATYNNVPILGVNVGTMGFMAELENHETELLRKVVEGDYTIDERIMLDISVRRAGEIIATDLALNDAVITKGAVARIIQLSILCDGTEAMNFSGDGVILSTPTGSTAYSMSAGGAIVEPGASNIMVTPICAHTLYTKPLILSDQRQVSVRIGKLGRKSAYLSVDGGRAVKLNTGDLVIAKKSEHKTKLVRVKNISFYQLINMKFKNS